jgi:hypothetical protein
MDEVEITRLDAAVGAGSKLVGSEVLPPITSSPYSLKLQGWALGPEGPPRGIWIVAAEPLGDDGTLHRVLVTTAPNLVRPDIAARFPDVPAAKRCGFSTACSLLGIPRDFSLRVEARLENLAPMTIAHIEGRRRALRTGYRPRFQPIMLKTFGRAGSTWVTHVIGAHPQALAYRPFQFEPRMLDYWLEIVRTQSHPHSYAQAIDPDVRQERAWWEGRARWLGPLFLDAEPAVERWVETEAIEEFGAFAQMRVDSFYGRVAESQDKPQALRFVERVHEWPEMVLARELYDEARTVFLVRDLRDLLASRLAFNRRTGKAQFGYDRAASPEEYVQGSMRAEADDMVESWRAQRQHAFLLRYEELMLHPEETLRELLEHLGLDHSDEAVTATLERARAQAPDRQADHRTSAGEAASIGRWRSDLAPELQDACAEAFEPALAEFGYEPARKR